jgi:hypothetical protein
MIRVRIALLAAALALPLSVAHADSSRQISISPQSPEQLIAGIERKHPAVFYMLAKKLFEAGQKDEAVFWFYAGQLRYRAYLKANPSLDPSGDPALFASLSEVVGRPLNQYAFGDIPKLSASIERALAWDEAQPDLHTPKTPERAEIVNGLRDMKREILAGADEIRKTRATRGLENR